MKKLKLVKLLHFIGALMPLSLLTSCSLFPHTTGGRSSLMFDNYELYMNDPNQEIINQYYHYNEYGDLPAFERDIDSGIAVGGIGSDYFSAKLADEGKIRKLDFSKILGITSDRSQWAKILQKLYTPTTWNILSHFTLTKMNHQGKILYRKNAIGTAWTTDWNPQKYTYYTLQGQVTQDPKQAVSHDVTGDGQTDYLWEFTVPYFLQNKVVAFNPYSFPVQSAVVKQLEEAKSQQEVQGIFAANAFKMGFNQGALNSYSNILAWLRALSAKTLTVNDYMRDNIGIGSENLHGADPFNTQIKTLAQGKQYLDQFKTILETSWKNQGGQIKPFETNGTKVLMQLNQVKTQPHGQTDVAIMYNGDALDAYQAGEWSSNYLLPRSQGQIRVLIPQNSAWFLDTVVMAKKTTPSVIEQDRFYQALHQALYGFVNINYQSQNYATNPANLMLQNFNLVQYTPAFMNLYNYVTLKENSFVKDKMALDILKTSTPATNLLLNGVISNDMRIELTNYDAKIGRSLQ